MHRKVYCFGNILYTGCVFISVCSAVQTFVLYLIVNTFLEKRSFFFLYFKTEL